MSVTVLIEWLAVQALWFSTWSYRQTMPLLPGTGIGIGIGMLPVLQWLTANAAHRLVRAAPTCRVDNRLTPFAKS